jgi:hypothetical protein
MGRRYAVIKVNEQWEYDCKDRAILKAKQLRKLHPVIIIDRATFQVIIDNDSLQN